MNKGVLAGGATGLLVLVLLGGYWFMAAAPKPSLPAESPAASVAPAPAAMQAPTAPGSTPSIPPSTGNRAEAATPAAGTEPTGAAPWAASNVEPGAKPAPPTLTREERRKIRAEVRRKMTELLAKGKNAKPADTLAFLDDVERAGQGIFDPRYFGTMREMVNYSARTQELSKELAQIASSKEPKAETRRQEILAEMRDLGDRFSNGAAALQTYARDTLADEKP